MFSLKSSQFSDLPSKYQAIQGDHGESEETKKRAKSMKRVNRQPHTNTHTDTRMSSRENNSAKQKRERENANSHSLLCRRRRVNFKFYFWVIATLADFSPTVVFVFVVKIISFPLNTSTITKKTFLYSLTYTSIHLQWRSLYISFFLFCSVLPLFVLCFGDIKPAFLYFVNNNYSFS